MYQIADKWLETASIPTQHEAEVLDDMEWLSGEPNQEAQAPTNEAWEEAWAQYALENSLR